MAIGTVKSKSCDRAILFELARTIYALHSAINQLACIPNRSRYREELIEKLNHRIQEFSSHGGIVEKEVDVFGEKVPTLSYPNSKEVIQYGIGRLACEQLLNF